MDYFRKNKREINNKVYRFSFRKTSVGLASVAISSLFFLNLSTQYSYADTISDSETVKLNNKNDSTSLKDNGSEKTFYGKQFIDEVNGTKSDLNNKVKQAEEKGFKVNRTSDQIIQTTSETEGLKEIANDYKKQSLDISQKIKENQRKSK